MRRSWWPLAVAVLLAGAGVWAQPSGRPAVAPVPQPLFLGPGVTMAMGPLKNPPFGSNIVSLHVTVANHSGAAVKLKCIDFSLSDAAGERSMALLPSELAYQKHPEPPLEQGILKSGESRSGTLYFRTPFAFPRPFDLRVDLETAQNSDLSRTFWPL